jgi:hypothetical protein
MPVIKQYRIYRTDLQNNPHVLYLFGDNNIRRGLGGQAGEMRGEVNAVGVRTKWAPEMAASAFFDDDEFATISLMIDSDLQPAIDHAIGGGVVVIPADGLGTGLSQLPERAPRVAAYLDNRLKFLASL